MLSEEELERFRTKFCVLARGPGGSCDFGVEKCNYSHNQHWTRRCPIYLKDTSALRYLPLLCPSVKLGPGDTVSENVCQRGNICPFSHSKEEIIYHPLIYKTAMCEAHLRGGCNMYYCWKVRFCPSAGKGMCFAQDQVPCYPSHIRFLLRNVWR